jgi:alternative squalene epoxidase
MTGDAGKKNVPMLASPLFDSGSETSGSDNDEAHHRKLDNEKKNHRHGEFNVPAVPVGVVDETSSRSGAPSCSCLPLPDAQLPTSEDFEVALMGIPYLPREGIASSLIMLVWPLMWTVPLVLSNPSSPLYYQLVFPSSWYQNEPAVDSKWSYPQPLGLLLGIFAVAVGQVWVWILFYIYRKWGNPKSIQSKGAVPYEYPEGLRTHVSQPEGFGLLVGYLAGTWLLRLLPASYYEFDGTIQWKEAALCLVLQDGIQYAMHMLEHLVSPAFYQISHKPHHRFTNPRIFDAFNGSLLDTLCMINLPLFVTAHLVRNANVWTYMTFGSTYACWLTLIHSEYVFPWDAAFRLLGLGTPGDHHVHHKFFKYNYGHLFMWFDRVGGTYRDPRQFAPKVFNEDV